MSRVLWIERLDELEPGRGLAEAVAWLASPEVAEREAARSAPMDLADAAPLGPVRGAARLLRRGLLRALAARLLSCQEEDVLFERGEQGGVRLLAPSPAYASSAGRGSWSVVALGPVPLGVDVELATPEPPLPIDLLNPGEQASLAALPPAERPAAFARLWVTKEAYAKAIGQPLEAVLGIKVQADVKFRGRAQVIAAWVQRPEPSPRKRGEGLRGQLT